MKWYIAQFDPSWVKCRNYHCKSMFTRTSIQHKRKCPSCKMGNNGNIRQKTNKAVRNG